MIIAGTFQRRCVIDSMLFLFYPNQDKQMMVCEEVKSIAVVKYASIELPGRFTQLHTNFNLNEPPANWLHGGSKWENYLRELSLGKDKSFTR